MRAPVPSTLVKQEVRSKQHPCCQTHTARGGWNKLSNFRMPAQIYSEGSCMATQETALRVQLNQLYSPSKPNPQTPESGQ